MITFITRKIAIGEYADAMNDEALKSFGIDCILNVNDVEFEAGKKAVERLEMPYFWSPVPRDNCQNNDEMKEDFRIAVATLLNVVTWGYNRILVHCVSGVDRSPLVVALYLCEVADLELPQAYELVKQQRKHIMFHYEWVDRKE
jgi:protein-tyrosine phosphatase